MHLHKCTYSHRWDARTKLLLFTIFVVKRDDNIPKHFLHKHDDYLKGLHHNETCWS